MILVTGATGMTGQFVIQALQQRGHAVRVLVRILPGRAPPHTDLAIGDLADPASLRRACDGVVGIVHTACTFTDSAVDIAAMRALLDGWQDGPLHLYKQPGCLRLRRRLLRSPRITRSAKPTGSTGAAR